MTRQLRLEPPPPRRRIVGVRWRGAEADLLALAARRLGVTVSELVREATLGEVRRVLTTQTEPVE